MDCCDLMADLITKGDSWEAFSQQILSVGDSKIHNLIYNTRMIDVRCSFTEIEHDKTLIKKWAKALWFVLQCWRKGWSNLPIRSINSSFESEARSHNAWAPKRPWGNGRSQPCSLVLQVWGRQLERPPSSPERLPFCVIFMTKIIYKYVTKRNACSPFF